VHALKLSFRLARWDWPATVGIAASAAAFGALFATAVILNATYQQAIADGVASDNGRHAYRLEVVDSSAAVTAQLAQRRDWIAVWKSSVQVRAGSRLVPAQAASTQASAVLAGFGELVAGRAPTRPNEVSVSRSVADDLAVGVGDTVAIATDGDPSVTGVITGVYVNAMRPDEVSIYRRLAAVPAEDPDTWLSDTSPAADQNMLAAYEQGLIKFRSTGGLVADQQEQAASSVLAPLRYLPQFFALVAAVLLTGALAALRIRVRPTIEGLGAAGMPTGQAVRIPLLAAAGAVLAGVAIGQAAAIVSTTLARSALGATFDQYWQHVTVPYGWLAGLLVGLPTLLFSLFTGAAAGRRRAATVTTTVQSRSGMLAVLSGAIVGLVLLARADRGSSGGVSAALYGGLLVSAALPGILLAAGLRMRASVATHTARTFAMSIAGTAIVISTILFVTSFFSVRLASTGAEAVSAAEQPPGTLVVDGVSDADADAVTRAYRRFSADTIWRLRLPAETVSSLRVVTPAFAACVQALPRPLLSLAGDCPTGDSLTPLNRTSITDPSTLIAGATSPDTVLADPQLIQNGRVGLLDFDVNSHDQAVKRTIIVNARPLPGLGGNLPGAVLDPRHPAAAQPIRQPHVDMVVLHGFGALPETRKAEVRGAVVSVAGYATISEDQELEDRGSRLLAMMITIAGTLIIVILLLAGAAALTTGQADFRNLLGQLGISAPRRLVLGLRILAIPGAGVLLATMIAAFASQRSGSNVRAYPALLTIPATGAAVTVLICAALYARSPDDR
jgi:hypothetical protein